MTLQVKIEGNDFFRDALEKYPAVANKAARMAINSTLDKGYTRIKRRIGEKANLKPAYIAGRLTVRKADDNRLSGSIVGRYRGTSLARFDPNVLYGPTKSGTGKKRAGVSVKVRNLRRKMSKAFLMQLKNENQGLAIRIPKGQKPKRIFDAKPLYSPRSGREQDVYLLYGPSVHQIMTSDKQGPSVLSEVTPELTDYLNNEFQRQFARLSGGR